MKLTILDAATLGEGLDFHLLDKYGEVAVYENTSKEDVAARLAGTDIAIINKVKINAENLAGATNLKLICIFATGYDNVNLADCRARGVAVCNVRGYSTHSVAQLTWLMALTLTEKLNAYTNAVKDGSYQASGIANKLSPVYREIYGKTWGIVGAGAIGSQVAKVAEAFGCIVLAYKRTPSDKFNCVPLDTLLKESDIVSLHTPLNDGTRSLIGEKQLALMKPDALLINVARGAVTDETAVAYAIKNGIIGGFASDVYTTEPFPKDHPFNEIMNFDNVLLTPHMAWGAYEARVRCLEEIIKNTDAFLRGESRCRVDTEEK